MLTSEKAALSKVRELYKNIKAKKLENYLDPDFGPKDKSDVRGHRFSLYKDGQVPEKGYTEPEEIEWVYADALCDPGETPQFVDDGAASNDCV
jgi:hypothetical protein